MSFTFGKKTKADAILIAFCLALSVVLYFLFVGKTEPGTRAVVRIDGVTVAEYPLNVDGTYPLNGGTNVLVIDKGYAYMDNADCPDKLCVKQGAISRSGQCITCLPHKLTVTVEGGSSDVDILVG